MKNTLNTMLRACFLSAGMMAAVWCRSSPKVTLQEDAETFTLSNGIVRARVSKVTGDLVSLRYHDLEMLATTLSPDFIPEPKGSDPADNPNWREPSIAGRAHAYWSHDAMGVKGSAPAKPAVTIDPEANGGQTGEVSVKAISAGRKMGTGPGTNPAEGNVAVDVEIRYTLERDAPGVYTYCIFTHQTDYPLAQFAEARHIAKLAAFFDWMSVDSEVNFHYPKEYNAGDKYVYTATQSENPAFGWSSTTKKVGLFFINPSMEYMGGGPTKVEFLGHRDTNKEAAPCVLNYWRSSHYGGAEANIAAGEKWEKIIGPVFIYANGGGTPEAIYADAKARAKVEAAKWPYEWVAGVDYPKAGDRAAVRGQLEVEGMSAFGNLNVGLTAGEYASPREASAPAATTSWQRDAKFYQFWAKGNADGSFEIPKVRPGKYTLHAFADGILGEYVQAGVVVEKGKPLSLGKLRWTPVRRGRQLWDVGIPNRSAAEFFKAGERRDPDISLKYAVLFPNDITYTIGKSDFSKDWFFQHVPHNEDAEAKSAPFYGVRAVGRATPYRIAFGLPAAPKGKVTLRLAICGTGAKTLSVEVNGKPAGSLENLTGDGVITRHGSQGLWYEREVAFDADLLKKGDNTLTLIVPQGAVNNGIVYDYIRLELDEE
jgi:rhamnogalacturonan endolyase